MTEQQRYDARLRTAMQILAEDLLVAIEESGTVEPDNQNTPGLLNLSGGLVRRSLPEYHEFLNRRAVRSLTEIREASEMLEKADFIMLDRDVPVMLDTGHKEAQRLIAKRPKPSK